MARHHLLGVTLAAWSLAVGACGAAPGSETASSAANVREVAVAELRAADSTLQVAVEAKDAQRTAALYMADATLLPIAEPAVVGRAAIQQAWANVYGIPGFRSRARITRLEVAGGGDLGFTQGTYEATMTGADGRPVVEGGKWVTVWRRDADGQWRVATDIANTDAPPPEHQESTAHGSAARPTADAPRSGARRPDA